MNALVRKEIRLMLPAWIGALLLATLPVWLVWPGPYQYVLQPSALAVYAPFALGVVLLGLAPFGQELSMGTFSILLAQPVSRNRIWKVKTSILVLATAAVFVALCVSNYFRTEWVIKNAEAGPWRRMFASAGSAAQMSQLIADTRYQVLNDSLAGGGACALAALAGGLWTTLLFRNTSAAFWTSLISLLGLGLIAGKVFGGLSEWMANAGLLALLGGYAAAGFLWAGRFFPRMQDNQWTGGALSLPRLFAAETATPARRRQPWRALLRKEFQLHQINLVVAGLLLLAHLVVIAIRRMSASYFALHPMAASLWESWPMVWLAMPLLIGGAAVAEERKLGTLEHFLCLPATRRREFAVKFLTAMLLGVFLGGVMPLLVEWLGVLTGLPRRIFDAPLSLGFNTKLFSLATGVLTGAAGLTFISFHASTLTRNLLQALGLGVVLSLFWAFVVETGVVTTHGRYFGESVSLLWHGPLLGQIGWPVIIGTVMMLAWRNFNHLNVGVKIWGRNGLTLLAALLLTAGSTTLIYHRVWELWIPDEPPHRDQGGFLFMTLSYGRQTGGNDRARPHVEGSPARLAMVSSDGRLWLRQRPTEIRAVEINDRMVEGPQPTRPWREGYAPGSDWREVAVAAGGCFAIQADGSLWDLSQTAPGPDGTWEAKAFGESRDWKTISADGNHFTALKRDGTMWQWGEKPVSPRKNEPPVRIPIPVRVGDDSDWVAVCDSRGTTAAAKSDGSIWRFGNISQINTNGVWRSAGIVERPEKWVSLTGHHPVSLSLNFGANLVAAICDDGTLWIGGSVPIILFWSTGNDAPRPPHGGMIQWGSDLAWREARFVRSDWYGGLAAVTREGELREWTAARSYMPATEKRSSRYSVWLSACRYDGSAFLALAKDGALCVWSDAEDSEASDEDWLQPSRIKARTIANIQNRVRN